MAIGGGCVRRIILRLHTLGITQLLFQIGNQFQGFILVFDRLFQILLETIGRFGN
jgi:hypothetical protein